MTRSFRNQFSIAAFGLQHDRPSDFYLSSWQKSGSPVPMLVFRLLSAAGMLGILLWSLLTSWSEVWFIYMTNWGHVLLTTSSLCGLLVSLLALWRRQSEDGPTPAYAQIYWLLYNTSLPITMFIALFYWVLLYNPDADSESNLWLDISIHGINTVIMVAELLVTRTPSQLLHIYMPFGFGSAYLIFSGIYYAAGGLNANGDPYVYAQLDWSEPGPTGVVVALTALGIIGLHVLVVIIAWMRNALASLLVQTRGHDLPTIAELPEARVV